MQELLLHLLKSSALIGIFYFAYLILLKQETSFMQNRKFLMVGLVSSVVLPFIYFTQKEYIAVETNEVPYIAFTQFTPQDNMVNEEPIDWWQIGFYVYFLGLVVMVFKFLLQLYSLQNLINSGKKKRYKTLKLVRTTKNIKPFSFFKYIVFNPDKHREKHLKLILKHEQIHAKQWHSLDVIFASILSIAFWFNPFIWLYKKAIIQNLEFLADQDAVASIASKQDYQKALVMATVGLQPAMTNQFYQSFIKKRIIMLNKSKKKNNQWKPLLVIPILCLFLYSFNLKTENISLHSSTEKISQLNDTLKKNSISGKVSYEENENAKLPIRSKDFEILGENALYILDHKTYTKSELTGNAVVFKSIQVIKPKTAEKQFGKKGKDGAVLLSNAELIEDFQGYLRELDKQEEAINLQFLRITSRKKPEIITLQKEQSSVQPLESKTVSSDTIEENNSKTTQNDEKVKIVSYSKLLKDTLYVLNGVPKKDKSFLQHLKKENIENITYIQGDKAKALYGSRVSEHGVKLFTTKVEDSNALLRKKSNPIQFIRINDSAVIDGNRPLYVLNGKVISLKEFKQIQPENIKAVYVIKGKKAAAKYKDENAAYGVVEVYTIDFKRELPGQSATKVFVYTIHQYETDAAINKMIALIKKEYDIEVDIKKLHRNTDGMINSIKMKAKHTGSSSWNVTYSSSNSSDHVETIYMIMDTESGDFKITNQKPEE